MKNPSFLAAAVIFRYDSREKWRHLLNVGALAADVTAEAIVRGVSAAVSIPGYPAAVDLEETTR